MSIEQKIAHRAETATDAAKKLFQRATGKGRLQDTKDHLDQAAGNLKDAQDRAAEAYRRLSRAMAGPATSETTLSSP